MIPNRRWFPGTLQERAAWFNNFDTQFQMIGPTLGFTAADVTAVTNDKQNLQDIAVIAMQLDAYAEAVRQYRIIITEGAIGDPTPGFPALPGYKVPGAVATGTFERLDSLVKRILVAPAYTDEIGAMLGIIPSTPTPTPEPDMKPVMKASDSFGGYKFEVNVTRLGTTAFKVQVQRNGNGNWTDAAFATNNPAIITLTPTTPGQPERIMVRAVLLKNNEPVGQPSDPTYVTGNP